MISNEMAIASCFTNQQESKIKTPDSQQVQLLLFDFLLVKLLTC